MCVHNRSPLRPSTQSNRSPGTAPLRRQITSVTAASRPRARLRQSLVCVAILGGTSPKVSWSWRTSVGRGCPVLDDPIRSPIQRGSGSSGPCADRRVSSEPRLPSPSPSESRGPAPARVCARCWVSRPMALPGSSNSRRIPGISEDLVVSCTRVSVLLQGLLSKLDVQLRCFRPILQSLTHGTVGGCRPPSHGRSSRRRFSHGALLETPHSISGSVIKEFRK